MLLPDISRPNSLFFKECWWKLRPAETPLGPHKGVTNETHHTYQLNIFQTWGWSKNMLIANAKHVRCTYASCIVFDGTSGNTNYRYTSLLFNKQLEQETTTEGVVHGLSNCWNLHPKLLMDQHFLLGHLHLKERWEFENKIELDQKGLENQWLPKLVSTKSIPKFSTTKKLQSHMLHVSNICTYIFYHAFKTNLRQLNVGINLP